jgi:TIR domain-containing protein/Leucine Rich Repeat (LRR) protein
MACDQGMVKQLQQRLKIWNPDRQCTTHSQHKQCCTYDEQGRLSILDLCGLELSQVPPEVWSFSSLRQLYLGYNQISTLPAEVGNLSSLRQLFLTSNQISSLPAEVGNLSSLQVLSLDSNQLSSLPTEVGNLFSLQWLSLGGNQLSSLPAGVGNLSSLQVLFLNSNQLSSLPAEVGNLSSLRELFLTSNQISSLPAEVGNLSSLQVLSLDNNQLSSLPAEVGNLSSLQHLSLSGNQINSLPPEMGNLSSLRHLSLSGNQISTLPAEVGNLSSLQWLNLVTNPLRSPPLEIIVQGIPAILAYLRTMQTIKIFYCYAHEDKDLRDQIDKHLGILRRLGHIREWYDREIQAGTEWEREIERNLGTAHIILLLVSADFVNSDYCYSVEMKKALELHNSGQARVLPILLRPVDWQDAPFAKLQMLPAGAIPITKWHNQDEALEDVARGIRNVVNSLRSQKKE